MAGNQRTQDLARMAMTLAAGPGSDADKQRQIGLLLVRTPPCGRMQPPVRHPYLRAE